MSVSKPELSKVLFLKELDRAPAEFSFEAGPGERRRLAARLGLERIGALAVSGVLERTGPGEVRLYCDVAARLRQRCVVSLDAFDRNFRDSFTVEFKRGLNDQAPGWVENEDPNAWVEPLPDEDIDVGEIAVQFLALALDPYPKKPDVAVDGRNTSGGHADVSRKSPFAVLEKLKRGD